MMGLLSADMILLLISNRASLPEEKKNLLYLHRALLIISLQLKIRKNLRRILLPMNHSMAAGALTPWARTVQKWKSIRRLSRSLMTNSFYTITGFLIIRSKAGIRMNQI